MQFSESFEVDGREMFKHVCKTGLEGVVSKVRDSRYVSGRVNEWAKVTCAQRETLPIAGFALDGKKFDGIFVGRREGSDLIYAGKVDHGFTPEDARELQDRLKPLIRKTQPYSKRIIAAHGLSRRCWPKLNIAPNLPKANCATRSSRDCGRRWDEANRFRSLRRCDPRSAADSWPVHLNRASRVTRSRLSTKSWLCWITTPSKPR